MEPQPAAVAMPEPAPRLVNIRKELKALANIGGHDFNTQKSLKPNHKETPAAAESIALSMDGQGNEFQQTSSEYTTINSDQV
jgi:hypothetical protein